MTAEKGGEMYTAGKLAKALGLELTKKERKK